MTHFSNRINQKNLYTTERIPTFTFVMEGPDATNKKVDQSQTRRDSTTCLDPENSNTSSIHKQQHQQQNKHTNDTTTTTTTTRTVPSGPLHIVPSWQPLNANEKPPYSYATLIAHSLLSSNQRKLTLSEIYQWITQHYPFYSMTEHGWQNSIRHNLSLNKAFVRIQRQSKTTSGKGSFWTIRAGKEHVFIDNLIKRRGPASRKQSTNSPKTLQLRRSSHRLDVTNAAPTSDTDSLSHTTSTTNRNINSSHLFTTFSIIPTAASPSLSTPTRSSGTRAGRSTTRRKMSMPELNQRQNPLSSTNPEIEDGHESDCDSGVDFGHNSFQSQLKKTKSTPCLYDDHLYNNDAAMMDYTFETLLSTPSSSTTTTTSSSLPCDIAATDVLSNWTDSMNIVTPPLLEWNPLFSTDAALNLTCAPSSYQHLLSSTNTTLPILPTIESAPHFDHFPSSSPTAPSANGLLYHDYMFVDQLLVPNWSL